MDLLATCIPLLEKQLFISSPPFQIGLCSRGFAIEVYELFINFLSSGDFLKFRISYITQFQIFIESAIITTT